MLNPGRVPLPVGRAGVKPVGGRVGVLGRFDSCLFRFIPIKIKALGGKLGFIPSGTPSSAPAKTLDQKSIQIVLVAVFGMCDRRWKRLELVIEAIGRRSQST